MAEQPFKVRKLNINGSYILASDFDPSSVGLYAPVPSLYFQLGTTLIFTKTDIGDTDWIPLANTSISDQLTAIYNATGEPTGFPQDSNGEVDRTSSTISFNNSNRTFTIAPSSTSYYFYYKGIKYTKTTSLTKQIDDLEGTKYIYFDGNGDLAVINSFNLSFITKYVPVAIVYWDYTNKKAILFGDERHGCTMDSHTHARIHAESGAVYVSGSALSGFTIDGNGTSNTHTQFAIASGQVRDEDILHNLSSKSSTDSIPVLYRLGSNWHSVSNTNQKFHYVGGGRAYWNENTGGTYSLTEITNNDFVLYHIVSTNDINNPYFSIMGLNRYTTKNNAREGALTEISQYTGLPFTEFVFIATIIFQSSNTFSNTGKSIIVSTDTGGTYIDWRFSKTLNPTTANVNIHNSLGGLYGSSPFYHSNQSILTTDSVEFAGIKDTSNFSITQSTITTTGNLDSIDTSTTSSIRFNVGSATSIYGFANGINGKILYIHNAGTVDITIKNLSSSTGSNSIYTGTGADISLKQNSALSLQYDSSNSKWRIINSAISGVHNELTSIEGGDSSHRYHSDQQINKADSVQFAGLNINGEYSFPTTDGNASQVISTNGSGTLSFIDVNNTHNNLSGIEGGDSSHRYHSDQQINKADSVTFAGLSIGTAYSLPTSLGTSGQALVSNGTGLAFGSYSHANLSSIQGGEVGKYYHSDQEIDKASSVQFAGLTVAGFSYPTVDGSANTVLTTNGSKVLSFAQVSHANLSNIDGGGGGSYYHSDQSINTGDNVTFLKVSGNVTVNNTLLLSSFSNYTNTGILTSANISSGVSVMRLNPSADTVIHGLGSPEQGKFVNFINVSSFKITIANNSSTETTANNRILTGAEGNIILYPNASVRLIYDGSSLRWRVIGLNKHNNFFDLQGGDGTNYYHSNQPINTTDDVRFASVNIKGNYTLPTTDGTNGQTIITNGAGVSSFSNYSHDNLGSIDGGNALLGYYHSDQEINIASSVQFAGVSIGTAYSLPTSLGSNGQGLLSNGTGLVFGNVGSILDANIIRYSATLNLNATTNIATVTGSNGTGRYMFWFSSDPRVRGTLYVKSTDLANSELEISSNSVSSVIDTASCLNVYFSSSNIVFQNKIANDTLVIIKMT